jgi:sulfur-carrier protein adenylyltransferase/sulfurtransferase
VANCAEAGVLGVLPGVLGTLQATEAIKLITGVGTPLTGRLLTYDALAMRFEEFAARRRRDCAVCGDSPSITEPQDVPAMTDTDKAAEIRRLSPRDLETLLRGVAPPLIDVREVYEFEAGHLPGAVNIPLAELPQQLARLAGKGAPVFMCRSGGRSLAACQLALEARIAAPANLDGGLRAWAAEVDPALYVL